MNLQNVSDNAWSHTLSTSLLSLALLTSMLALWILAPVCGIGGGTRWGTMGPCSQNTYSQVIEQVTPVFSPGGTRSLTMVFCNQSPRWGNRLPALSTSNTCWMTVDMRSCLTIPAHTTGHTSPLDRYYLFSDRQTYHENWSYSMFLCVSSAYTNKITIHESVRRLSRQCNLFTSTVQQVHPGTWGGGDGEVGELSVIVMRWGWDKSEMKARWSNYWGHRAERTCLPELAKGNLLVDSGGGGGCWCCGGYDGGRRGGTSKQTVGNNGREWKCHMTTAWWVARVGSCTHLWIWSDTESLHGAYMGS